jgi:hypothetical protein
MTAVYYLLLAQGLLGGFDTLYYHEYRARLPALGKISAPELRLHASRDFIYSVIFGTLPWFTWSGLWALSLFILLAAEIVITLSDFVVEDCVRRVLGGVYKGERVTHAVMAIVYGAMIANLLPQMLGWSQQPTALVRIAPDVGVGIRWLLTVMAFGVSVSGVRDLYAVFGGAGCSWPWTGKAWASDG